MMKIKIDGVIRQCSDPKPTYDPKWKTVFIYNDKCQPYMQLSIPANMMVGQVIKTSGYLIEFVR